MYVFSTFVENQKAIAVWALFWLFYSIVYVSMFLPVQCYGTVLLLWLCSIQYSGIMILPALLFLLRITFAIQILLCFHMNFMIDFSVSEKNDIGILMGIALNL
jgi:hypothetical protein